MLFYFSFRCEEKPFWKWNQHLNWCEKQIKFYNNIRINVAMLIRRWYSIHAWQRRGAFTLNWMHNEEAEQREFWGNEVKFKANVNYRTWIGTFPLCFKFKWSHSKGSWRLLSKRLQILIIKFLKYFLLEKMKKQINFIKPWRAKLFSREFYFSSKNISKPLCRGLMKWSDYVPWVHAGLEKIDVFINNISRSKTCK